MTRPWIPTTASTEVDLTDHRKSCRRPTDPIAVTVIRARVVIAIALSFLASSLTAQQPYIPPPTVMLPVPPQPVLVPDLTPPLAPCPLLKTGPGFVAIDLPWAAEVDRPFTADVSLEACGEPKPAPGEHVEVRMEQTSDTEYSPRVFTLLPGSHQAVTITVKKSQGGLAQVIASAPPWQPVYASLDVGFAASLRPRLDDTIEAGSEQVAAFDFVDSNGHPVVLGAPVSLHLEAEKGLLGAGADPRWSKAITLSLRRGATTTPPFRLRAGASAPDRGLLAAAVMMNETRVLRDQQFAFTIVPQWWLQLLVGVLGGLLHATSQTLIDYSRLRRRVRLVRSAVLKLLTGALAGSFAYLLASWNILGIRVDTTSLRAFALLGFLFSYLGVDAVVRRLLPETKAHGTGDG